MMEMSTEGWAQPTTHLLRAGEPMKMRPEGVDKLMKRVLQYLFFLCQILALPAVFFVKYLNIENHFTKLFLMSGLLLLFTTSLFTAHPFRSRGDKAVKDHA